MQIDARLLPVALHGSFRHSFHGGNLAEREATKKLQINHFSERRLGLGEFVQRLADSRKLAVVDGILQVSVSMAVISNRPPRF